MPEKPDYILDIDGIGGPSPEEKTRREGRSGRTKGRPWLSIHWRCCGAYSRIYRNPQGTAYVGWCPSCGRRARLRVGPNGTNQRMFVAY